MKIIFHSNAIKAETEKAVLIKLPKNELAFWHPKKCVRSQGKNGYQLIVWFANEDWKIKATRTSQKTFQVLQTIEKSIGKIAEQFNLQIIE